MADEWVDVEPGAGDQWSDSMTAQQLMQKQMIDDMPWHEKALVGAGKKMTDFGRGGANLWDQVTGDDRGIAERKAQALEEQQLYAPLQEHGGLAVQAGELLPYLASAPLSGGLATQMAISGDMGALDYNPESSAGERAVTEAGTTAAITSAFGLTGRVLNAMKGGADDILAKIKPRGGDQWQKKAKDLGFRLTRGQASGDAASQQIETSMRSNPVFSGLFQDVTDSNQQNLNRIAARSIGVDHLNSEALIDENVLSTAALKIGDVFKEATQRVDQARPNGLMIAPAKFDEVAEGMTDAGRQTWERLQKRHPGLMGKAMTGSQIAEIRTTIERNARNLRGQGLGEAATDLSNISSILDDAIENAIKPLSPELFDDLKTARTHWGNLRALERTNVINAGNVSPRSLKTALTQERGKTFTRGYRDSELDEAARVSAYMAPIIGDSGTATRSFLSSSASNPGGLAVSLASRPLARGWLEGSGSAMDGLLTPGNIPEGLLQAALAAGRSDGE